MMSTLAHDYSPLLTLVGMALFALGPGLILYAFFFESDSVTKPLSLQARVMASVIPNTGRVNASHALFGSLLFFATLLLIQLPSPDEAQALLHREVVEFDNYYSRPLDAATTEALMANGNVVLYRPVGKLARLMDWMDHPFGGRHGWMKSASGDLAVLTLGAGHIPESTRALAGTTVRVLPRFMVHSACTGLSPTCTQDATQTPLALADVRDHLIAQGQDLSGVTDDLAKATALRIGLWTLFGVMPIFGLAVLAGLRRERKLRREFAQIFARTPWRAFPTTYVIRPHVVVRFLPGQFFSFWTTLGTVSKALPVTTVRFNYRPPGGADEDLVGVSVPLGRGRWLATRIFLPNSLIRRIEAEQRRLGIAPPVRPGASVDLASAADSTERFDRQAA